MPEWVHWITAPLMGAVIGYFTNLIAVKMLFRPLHPVVIHGFQLPFTPGLIPKEKPRLARALGDTVGKTLFTAQDVENALLSEQVEGQVVESLTGLIWQEQATLRQTVGHHLGEEAYLSAKKKLVEYAGTKTVTIAQEMALPSMAAAMAEMTLLKKVEHTPYHVLLTDKRIGKIGEIIREELDRFLQENASKMVSDALGERWDALEKRTPAELLEEAGVSREKLYIAVQESYRRIVRAKAGEIVLAIDVPRVVREKIDGMDVRELEALTLSVMKTELDAIVNLGALIGFVLGCVNLVL